MAACSPSAGILKPFRQAVIDTTGIYFTPEMRHFDRGWKEPDEGQYRDLEYVFGASAAAALYRREMIDDISGGGEFFDPDFFAYREDADVAWRAQLMGWRCLYVPDAVWLPRSQRRSGRPARRAGHPQHAFREKSVPDAHQERDGRPVPPLLASDDRARPSGCRRLPAVGTEIATGVLAGRTVLSPRAAPPKLDHAPPPGERRKHRAVVPRQTGRLASPERVWDYFDHFRQLRECTRWWSRRSLSQERPGSRPRDQSERVKQTIEFRLCFLLDRCRDLFFHRLLPGNELSSSAFLREEGRSSKAMTCPTIKLLLARGDKVRNRRAELGHECRSTIH